MLRLSAKLARSYSWLLAMQFILAMHVLASVVFTPLVTAAEKPTRFEAETTVARLSDQEVRDLLIRQLAPADIAQGEGFNPAVILYRLQRDIGHLSAELKGIFAAVDELPSIFPQAWASFSAEREQGGLLWFAVALLVSMGAGGFLAWLIRLRVTRVLEGSDPAGNDSTVAKCKTLGWQFVTHLVYISAFALFSSVLFIVAFDDTPKDRITFFFYLAAAAIFIASIAVSRAIHAPGRAELRLPLYSDAEAQTLHRAVLTTTGFGAFAYFTCALMGTLGILGEVHELFLILVGLSTATLLMYTIVSSKVALSRDLASGAQANSARGIFARLWPWSFATLVGLTMLGLIVRELLYDFVPYGAALFTIGLMGVVPALDALLYREAQSLTHSGHVVSAALLRAGRFSLLVLVTLALCVAWRLNPFSHDGDGLSAAIAAVFLQLTVVMLVAYSSWQLVRIVIDQKIAEEDAQLLAQGIDTSESEVGGSGLSRMRTLLPLFKRSLQVSIFVIAAMIVLAALGVDIAPLLAGAGVLGLAVGFGSQALVRDIVSGAFFLLDDAFRIGEYIDVGSVKGSVEKMSVRSVRLRHHRGAVHTVPFGEVKTLTNYSRDWAIMKLKFRVPFDTNVDKVRKLLKATGLILAENPDIKDDFIQPFKSQGATEADDYGFIITTKFMSKPGKQFVIRRYAFAAVQKAFAEHGIEFATPKVEVSVEDDAQDADRRPHGKAGAAAKHLLAQAEPSAG
ncbi:MAG: small-conductance mechanosensitive channel [Gammaproteobacteria bacterium]|jgi:small-conductance mechanosensitive channel